MIPVFSSPGRRATAACLLGTLLVLASGCGNRQPFEQLKADATGVSVDQAAAGAPEVPVGAVGGQAVPAVTAPGSVAAPGAAAPAAPGSPAGTASSSTGSAGQDGKPAANGGATTGKGTGAACASALPTVKIGSVGANSGVLGAQLGPGPKALQAWVQWMNAKGGVNCHPVELFVGDDGSDPATNQSLVQNFVEANGVVAFVFMNSPVAGEASAKYLTAKGIPVFGSEGGSIWFNLNPTYLPQMTSGEALAETVMAMAGDLTAEGKSTIGTITCIELPACGASYAVSDRQAAKYGLKQVYKSQVSITQPNYTSTCLAAKNAGAEILFLVLDGNTDIRLARSCRSVGYQPILVTPAIGITPDLAADPLLDGLRVSTPVMPWFTQANPAIADFREALAKYAPALVGSTVTVQAWVAGQVFAAAAAKAGAELTSTNLLAGAFSIKNNDFGGLTAPLTYTKGAKAHPQPMCWWGLRFNGRDVTAMNNTRKCGKADPPLAG